MRQTLLALIALMLAVPPAEAGLRVCNRAGVTAKVALGRFDGKAWVSKGWWTIRSGNCQTLLSGRLDARYYYLYASDGGAGTWSGDTMFCTAEKGPFAISGRGGCAARGYDGKGFFEIDTEDKADYTQSLSN
jgi:uncharacterized membrane protein